MACLIDNGRMVRQAPRFDVNWADVDVGTTTKTVTVPVVCTGLSFASSALKSMETLLFGRCR